MNNVMGKPITTPLGFKIILVDDADNAVNFTGSLTKDFFHFTEDDDSDSGDGITMRAEITCLSPDAQCESLTIDGNAWRDLESSDSLGDFLREVFLEGYEPQDLLDTLASDLGVDDPGNVL